MTLLERLPAMTDAEVTNLLTNARRLSTSGDPKRQAEATELLPALEQEAETRGAAKAEALSAARKLRGQARRKPAAETVLSAAG